MTDTPTPSPRRLLRIRDDVADVYVSPAGEGALRPVEGRVLEVDPAVMFEVLANPNLGLEGLGVIQALAALARVSDDGQHLEVPLSEEEIGKLIRRSKRTVSDYLRRLALAKYIAKPSQDRAPNGRFGHVTWLIPIAALGRPPSAGMSQSDTTARGRATQPRAVEPHCDTTARGGATDDRAKVQVTPGVQNLHDGPHALPHVCMSMHGETVDGHPQPPDPAAPSRSVVIERLAAWGFAGADTFVDQHGVDLVGAWVARASAIPDLHRPGGFVRKNVLEGAMPPAAETPRPAPGPYVCPIGNLGCVNGQVFYDVDDQGIGGDHAGACVCNGGTLDSPAGRSPLAESA